MLHGWKTATAPIGFATTANVVIGRIVSTAAHGPDRRLLVVKRTVPQQATVAKTTPTDTPKGGEADVSVGLDAQSHPRVAVWQRRKGARKLLAPGVTICINIAEDTPTKTSDLDHQNDMAVDFWATDLQIISALPAAPYVARLLLMPWEAVEALFQSVEQDQEGVSRDAEIALAAALRYDSCLYHLLLKSPSCLSMMF